MWHRDHGPDAHPFGPVLLARHIAKSIVPRKSAKERYIIEHDGVQVDVSKSYIDDCTADGQMEVARWYRDGQVLVVIYHWTM